METRTGCASFQSTHAQESQVDALQQTWRQTGTSVRQRFFIAQAR